MYYNLAKTAELLGLQTGDVNRLREQGKLRAFKDGADWKFRKEEVEQYLTKMIKERSGQNSEAGLLSSENDGGSASDVDSSAFDAMFDQAGDAFDSASNPGTSDSSFNLSLTDDGFKLADDNAEDLTIAADHSEDLTLAADHSEDLTLAADNADDLKLADDNDDDFKLADEAPEDALVKEGDSPLTSEDSALAEDLAAVDLTSASGSGSGDGLTLGSDSGLSLLDEVGGSNVDLAGDDLILGGSSGSGSGDGMTLGSDSGLSLMDDADGGFELDAAVSEQGGLDEVAAKKDDEDDSVFALAGETPDINPQILNLDQNADSEAPTELAPDESIFELSSQTTAAPLSSDSQSSSNFMKDDAPSETLNPFVTDDGEDEESDIFSIADEQPASVGESASRSIDVVDEVSNEANSDIFKSDDESTDTLFGASQDSADFGSTSDGGSSPFADMGSDFGSAGDGASSPFSGSSVDSSSDFMTGGSEVGFTGGSVDEQYAQPSSSVSSMQFTGKDLIFLVPCLIFLLLATIGALELCRTIWSYQEGTFDIGGPLLEAIAKMVKMM